MKPTVHLLIGSELHTTGGYFERALREIDTCETRVWTDRFDAAAAAPQDLVLFIDPGPARFPLGIEGLPCPTACYVIDVHQELGSRVDIAFLFDHVYIPHVEYLGAFVAAGISNVRWLPVACDPAVHHAPGAHRDIDVGFVGKLGRRGSQRFEYLASVLPRFHTNDYRSYASPGEMGRIYSRSKIVFNASINGDLNMRVFEAMAAGALLVTDRIGNGLDELFTEGEHYIGYSSVAEAVEQIGRFLADDEARCRIAQAGQDEVFARHTYAHRMRTILGARPVRAQVTSWGVAGTGRAPIF